MRLSDQRLSPRRLGNRVSKTVKRLLFSPRVAVRGALPLTRLGTEYGGWEFIDLDELQGATILSCGLGEDASFDVEFAATYGARVVIVDPTPRAVQHFRSIEARLGLPAEGPYACDGRIEPSSYQLEKVFPGQLTLVEAALAGRSGVIRFYSPPDAGHVSHSIINFQNDYSTETPFIEVPAVTVQELLPLIGRDVPLMKMDIEGAEIEVIPHLLEAGLRPTQLLVEFDELNRPSKRSRSRFEGVNALLLEAGYIVAFHDGRSNFLYVRSRSSNP